MIHSWVFFQSIFLLYMEAISLIVLVSPLLVSEKILLFSVSGLDKKEVVSKKVGKCPHCRCDT